MSLSLVSGTERCPQKGVVKQVATKLVQALSEKGLALLVNHGIPDCKVYIHIHIRRAHVKKTATAQKRTFGLRACGLASLEERKEERERERGYRCAAAMEE